jgi:cyclopropane-fatty-acyl-phospholipid synthase
MLTASSPAATDHLATARAVLEGVFGPPEERQFRIQLPDGSSDGPDEAAFTLVIKRPGALRRMFLPPSELAVGEAYLRDDFDVDGDMEATTHLDALVKQRLVSPAKVARLVPLLRSLPDDDLPAAEAERRALSGRRHSIRRDREAVRAHYDVGNDFYALWLDERMVYSCAYFTHEDATLDDAQEAKLDHICRKLRLQPRERFLDIGCGWGSLVMHAASRYGVEATGITLSEPQAQFARERIAAAGLEDRCRIEVRDYREMPEDARFDKIASVGMVEHVGRSRLQSYFRTAFRLLEPGGSFLNHGIVELPGPRAHALRELPMNLVWRPRSFLDTYVFPDGELLPFSMVIGEAEGAGFETRDVESLREHYAMTLRHWIRRLEARHDEAAALVGERTYRVWRLYMAGSARAFTTASLSVVQTVLAKPMADGTARVPLTRADVYAQANA